MEELHIVKDLSGNEHVVIDNSDGSFTSMLKSTYDELQVQQAQRIEGAN
jgi:calcineurin-like phosphoesterase family protein